MMPKNFDSNKLIGSCWYAEDVKSYEDIYMITEFDTIYQLVSLYRTNQIHVSLTKSQALQFLHNGNMVYLGQFNALFDSLSILEECKTTPQ